MLHPSYTEIMEKVNEEVEQGTEPVVNSRYSIVIASAKRARQIIEAQKYEEAPAAIQKPLSKAVEEIYSGTVKILSEEEANALEENIEAAVEEILAEEETEDTEA